MTSYQIINKSSASSFNDEETIYTFASKYSIKENSYNQYIAVSPDGTQIVTLNTETYQLKLCKFDNLKKFYIINYDGFKSIGVSSVKLNWSLSVSNEFILADGTVDSLIAVSCFNDDYMKYKNRSND